MMRAQSLRHPSRDICVFCAIRLQLRTESTSYTQKRFLRHYPPVYKPDAAAPTQQVERKADHTHTEPRGEYSGLDSGWAKGASHLKRDSELQEPPLARWTLGRPDDSSTRRRNAKLSYRPNFRSRDQIRDQMVDQQMASARSRESSDSPVTLGGRNSGLKDERASAEPTQLDVARDWKHVRRRPSASEGERQINTAKKVGEAQVGTSLDSVAQQQQQRLRASENGRFVGFSGIRKFETGPLPQNPVAGSSGPRGKAEPSLRPLSKGSRPPTQNRLRDDEVVEEKLDLTDKAGRPRIPGLGGPAWIPKFTSSRDDDQIGSLRDPFSPRQAKKAFDRDPDPSNLSQQNWTKSSTAVKADHSETPEETLSSTPKSVGWTAWRPPVAEIDISRIESLENQAPPSSGKLYTVPVSAKAHIPEEIGSTGSSPTSWKAWKAPQMGDEAISRDPMQQNEPSQDRNSPPIKQGRIMDLKAGRRAEKFIDEPITTSPELEHSSYRDKYREKSRRKQRSVSEYDDEEDLAFTRQERRRERKKDKAARKAVSPPTPIILPEFISISNLATALRVRVEDFVSRMESLGFDDMNNDHVLDAETAGLIAAEFNFEPVIDRGESEDLVAHPPAEDKSLLAPRPPVVTIMGHVDHGKTTLLDWLRNSSVAASEHGGITQHIGAFTVPMPSGKIITFLDTPGHAAFLSMRQRGANVTDIVILVVAADDSVKPQTIEAIKHAQAAKVPIIVAINKIDKDDANAERVKQDLARHGVDVEDFGGDTQVVCVSGKTGQGMEELEDAVVALADILDMRAETDGQAEGWVLEATTKKAGRVATVLVRRGTIRPSDVIVAGTTWTRVRSLRNEAGTEIASAGPGTPVEVDGWREQPEAGDEVIQAPDEQKAKAVVALRVERAEMVRMAADMTAINASRRMEQEKRTASEDQAPADEQTKDQPLDTPTVMKTVFFIIKADVSGSAEAVLDSVSALGNAEVRPHILRSAVGVVSESDVEHAAVAKGSIISFNLPVDQNIARMANAAGVKILDHNIIYRLVEDVKAKMSEYLPTVTTSRVVGEAEIAQVFDINVKGRVTVPVAGCRVRNGVVSKGAKVKVLRGGETVYDGTLSSLKNQKKDVPEMRKGSECGLGFAGFTEFKVGDQVQCYEEKVEKRVL